MKRIMAGLLAGLCLLSLTACGAEPSCESTFFAMDTVMSFAVYGEGAQAAVTACQQEINALEDTLSRTRDTSEISLLNREKAASLTGETLSLLRRAEELSALTGGLFDVTVAPLVDLWAITSEHPRVPEPAEIEACLAACVGPAHLHLTEDGARLDAGCSIDLGGIAKGYAAHRVRDILEEHGVQSAAVSLGGNAYVRGTRPDGKLWSVGIQDPADLEKCCAYLALSDRFVVTSGGYQRYFTDDSGRVYHHILDPRTGYPADSGLTSVTVIGQDGTAADALSTALFIMGEDAAVSFWRAHPELQLDLLLITADGRILCTLSADTVTIPEGSTYVFEALA